MYFAIDFLSLMQKYEYNSVEECLSNTPKVSNLGQVYMPYMGRCTHAHTHRDHNLYKYLLRCWNDLKQNKAKNTGLCPQY